MSNFNKVLFLLSFSIFVFFSKESSANMLGDFKMSEQLTKIDQRRTVGSGSRSQCKQRVLPKSVELLVPNQDVAHQTISSHPSLYLYSHHNQPLNLEFTLINPQEPKPLIKKVVQVNRDGIQKIALPSEIQLQEDTIYIWNIGIPCQNDPSRNQDVLSSGIKRVSLTPKLTHKISQTDSIREKIQIYAQNGIWYEALDLLISNKSQVDCYNDYLNELILSSEIE